MHARNELRETFVHAVDEYLREGKGADVVVDLDDKPTKLSQLCSLMRDCDDILPGTEFHEWQEHIDFPSGTYGAVARAIAADMRCS